MTDAASGKLPIIECVVTALRFFQENWQRFVPAALIVAAISAVWPLLNLGAPAEGETSTALSLAIADFIRALPSVVAGLFFSAAVLRWAIRGEYIAPTGLAFSADELRLLGVMGSLVLFFLPVIVLIGFILSVKLLSRIPPEVFAANDPEAMGAAIQAALGATGAAMLSLLILAAFFVMMLVLTRLFMVNAATMGERRIVIFQTWGWSRGNTMRMMGAILLIGVPVVLIDRLLLEFAGAIVLSIPNEAAWPAVAALRFGLAFVSCMTTIPLIALGALFYKGLRPPNFVAK